MTTATASDVPAIAAKFRALRTGPGRIVRTSNAVVCPAALVPYRTFATFGFSGIGRRDGGPVPAVNLAAPADLDLDFPVVVNPGCQRQLTTAVGRARGRTKVVHFADLVALVQADHR